MIATVLTRSLIPIFLLAAAATAGDFEDGKAAFDARDYDAARKRLDAALAADPAHAPARVLLAFIAFYFGQDKAAAAHLDEAEKHPARLATPDEDWGEWPAVVASLRVALRNPFEGRPDAAKLRGRTREGHYLLATDCGPPGRGLEEVGRLLEKIYDAYSAVFRFEKDRRLLSRVIVFDRREDYEAFTRALDPEDDGTDSSGYYHPLFRLLVIANDRGGAARGPLFEESLDTMFHEGFHQFLDYFVSDAPCWFDEGIAEYFGPSEVLPGGKELRVGVVVKERAGGSETRYRTIKSARPTPLRDFLLLDRDAFMARADVHYAQAWAFVHFLLHGAPGGKDLLVRYFKALRGGEDAARAFEETFGKVDLPALEKAFLEYVRGL